MLLLDVDNNEFERLSSIPEECTKGVLYGSNFGTHYEVLDYTVEFANYIFSSETEAKQIISEKYDDIEVTSQLTMFDI